IDTNRDVDVHSLPLTQRLLNRALLSSIYPLAAHSYPTAVGSATDLFVYRSLVVQYDALAGLTHQPVHRDASFLSLIISLSAPDEYSGGGTWIEPLQTAIAPAQGHVLMHPSAVRHAGGRISKGERWVLVVFLGHAKMRFSEHGRRFKARAARAAEEGRRQEELHLLSQALQVCPDDHELWSYAGGSLHDQGELQDALALYDVSARLNPRDPQPHNNRAAVMLEGGAPPNLALEALQYSLSLNKYLIPAWRNLYGLLLVMGRKEEAAEALVAMPEIVRRDSEIDQMCAHAESEVAAPLELVVHVCRSNRGTQIEGRTSG
ncbi:MAG: hypothetical protein SGPRY_013521, partial [Prymnesium sp.]